MIVQLTIGAALVIIVLTAKLVGNYKLWLQRKPVNHKKEWVFMALGCVPSIILYTLASDFMWYIAAPVSALMFAFFIWLFFDGIYNLLRRYGFFFTGSDDADDAVSDNFLQALPLALHVLIKTVPLGLLIYFYIKGL
jgi:hypothetical protein